MPFVLGNDDRWERHVRFHVRIRFVHCNIDPGIRSVKIHAPKENIRRSDWEAGVLQQARAARRDGIAWCPESLYQRERLGGDPLCPEIVDAGRKHLLVKSAQTRRHARKMYQQGLIEIPSP